MVPPANKLRSLRAEIKDRIKELTTEGRLTKEQREELRAAWDVFEVDYILAMKDFVDTGLQGEAVMRQAESFAALLSALMVHARGDVCRAKLVPEVLSIGTARVSGEQPSLIIPPWLPERMKALAVKTRRVAGLATHLLTSDSVLFGHRDIFFREFPRSSRTHFILRLLSCSVAASRCLSQKAARSTGTASLRGRFAARRIR